MRTLAAQKLREAMQPGRVYRRQELAPFCSSVTRDVNTLVEQGEVVRAAAGLYYRPRITQFGPAPATSEELIRAFLSDDDFLLLSYNDYNLLGLGLTQLYNQQLVYNRKRVGEFKLDGRIFLFKRPRDYPNKLTKEFLFIDLLNNKYELSTDSSDIELAVSQKAREYSAGELLALARRYGKVATRKFFEARTRS